MGRPRVADASAFEATFGPLQVTDHQTALTETLSWLRGHAGQPHTMHQRCAMRHRRVLVAAAIEIAVAGIAVVVVLWLS